MGRKPQPPDGYPFWGVSIESNGVYAAELVRLGPDVIVAQTAAAIRALQEQTQIIPIVTTGAGDVSTNGIVKNVAHTESNVTGVTNAIGSIGGKCVELLTEAAPAVQRIGVLEPEISGAIRGTSSYLPSIEEAARTLGMQILQIRCANAVDVAGAIDAFAAKPNCGLILLPPAPPAADRHAIFQAATQHRIPTLDGLNFLASEGGLMAYATSQLDLWRRRATSFVDQLLRGSKVSELPVEFPTRFDLVVNLTAAKAMGLTIPESFLLRGDELIQSNGGEFIAGLGVVALRLRPERRARRSQKTTRRLAIALNGWGFGTAGNYRQPIARTAFQARVPVSQVLS